jgi:uncharacterized protein YidB (DUF937 family)
MGLLDVLNGMQSGLRGQPAPSTAGAGMSPITMAILGLLVSRAVKGLGGGQVAGAAPGGNIGGGGLGGLLQAGLGGGGGLGGLLQAGLGGLLASGAAGGILSGGLSDLVKQFEQGGLGSAVNSWVGHGPNQQISPNDVARALGSDQINALMSQTGMSRDELLSGLSQQLPLAIDELTPDGRLPTEQEITQRIG